MPRVPSARPALLLVMTATAVASTGCAPFGQAGSARGPDEPRDPTLRELSCLAVAAHPLAPDRYDGEASLHVLYEFSNRCARPLHLDFSAVPADAVLSDGRRETLRAEPVTAGRLSGTLDAVDHGSESMGYLASAAIRAFCVDLSRLQTDSTVGAPPVCFRPAAGTYAMIDSLDDPDSAPVDVEVTAQPLTTTTNSETDIACTDVERGSATATFCNAFGVWERKPPVLGSLGMSTHHFSLAHRTVNGGDAFGAPGTLSGAPLGSAQSLSFDLDVDAFVVGPFYAGGELQIGGDWFAHDATLYDSPRVAIGAGSLYLSSGAVVGAALLRLGPVGLRAEVYGGGAVLQASPDDASTQGAQYQSNCTSDGCPTTWIPTWVLEPRARLNAWVNPWISVDGWGGVGVTEGGDWSAGFALTIHARSFDGQFFPPSAHR